jgi:hypothetical protein
VFGRDTFLAEERDDHSLVVLYPSSEKKHEHLNLLEIIVGVTPK